jgi:hypothetical protein
MLTQGTIGTLNSTTGTIANLSTTLAGDFTISQGTATLATSGATAGTYGSVTAIPFITVDAKGRITSATTGTFSSTPADGSITFAKLSTSTTESDNVASRTAKAWVRFNGATPTIASSFNVSSVSRGAAGSYTVNFATSMSDANYSAVITTSDLSGVASACAMLNTSAPTTTAFNANTVRRDNGAGFDPVYVSVVVFGS